MRRTLKNFYVTLIRFKSASLLNLIGLSVAFAAFTLIVIQLHYEFSYGTNDPQYDKIFRVEVMDSFTEGKYSPQVMDNTLINYLGSAEPRVNSLAMLSLRDVEMEVSAQDSSQVFKERVRELGNDISSVFNFDMVVGDFGGVRTPNTVAIPRSVADRVFGNSSKATGESMTLLVRDGTYKKNDERIQVTVCGVFEDLPQISAIPNTIYLHRKRTGAQFFHESLPVTLKYSDYSIFVNMQASDTAALRDGYQRYFPGNKMTKYDQQREFRLTRLDDIYFREGVQYSTVNGNIQITYLLIAVAILLLFIASINFINFSIALAPMRMRGFNTRLVFGESLLGIRLNILFDALGYCLIAFILSLFIVQLFVSSSWAGIMKVADISLTANPAAVMIAGITIILVGLLAGIYPAYYSTRFSPAIVLKGVVGTSTTGKWLRNALVGFQFVVSIGLIVIALFVWIQNLYLRSTPLGFDSENVVLVNAWRATNDEVKRFSEMLRANPDVIDVSCAGGSLGQYFSSVVNSEFNGIKQNLNLFGCRPGFLEFIKIPVIEGRDFTQEDQPQRHTQSDDGVWNMSRGKIIINRAARDAYSLSVDSVINNTYHIVGVCENFNTRSLYSSIEPMALIVAEDWITNSIYVRISNNNTPRTMEFLEAKFAEAFPDRYYSCTFLDDNIQRQYQKEGDFAKQITLFSIVTIVIALVGVFGLVLFEMQYRRKEIGIRRVYGAGIMTVLAMVSRKFMIIVAISFAIAAPVALYFVADWLRTFSYRTQIHWWVFALALVVVSLVTLLTVTIQAWRAATENPVNAIKSE